MTSYLITIKRAMMHAGHPTDGMRLDDERHNPNVYDCFMVPANNPRSAELFGMRWYQMFFGKQDPEMTRPAKCEAITDARQFNRIKKSGIYFLESYEMTYELPTGTRSACIAVARSADEAKKLANLYGIPKYAPSAVLLHARHIDE